MSDLLRTRWPMGQSNGCCCLIQCNQTLLALRQTQQKHSWAIPGVRERHFSTILAIICGQSQINLKFVLRVAVDWVGESVSPDDNFCFSEPIFKILFGVYSP